MSADVLILDLGSSITGNCQIHNYTGKILVETYSHGVMLPLQNDISNTERTAGRPVFSEMSLRKMSDVSTTELYKTCTHGKYVELAKLHVGRVEDGNFMEIFRYEMTNAMISSISTSGGGGMPADSFTINFTKLSCEYTQQQSNSTKKGTSTWNWSLEEMRST